MNSFFDKYKELFEFERFVGAPTLATAIDSTANDFLKRYHECCCEQQTATAAITHKPHKHREVSPRSRMDDGIYHVDHHADHGRTRPRHSNQTSRDRQGEDDKEDGNDDDDDDDITTSKRFASVPLRIATMRSNNQATTKESQAFEPEDPWEPLDPVIATARTHRLAINPLQSQAMARETKSEFMLLDPSIASSSGGSSGGRLRNRMEESKKIELLLGCGTSRHITGRIGSQGSTSVNPSLPFTIRRRLDAYSRLGMRRQNLFELLNAEWTHWKRTPRSTRNNNKMNR